MHELRLAYCWCSRAQDWNAWKAAVEALLRCTWSLGLEQRVIPMILFRIILTYRLTGLTCLP